MKYIQKMLLKEYPKRQFVVSKKSLHPRTYSSECSQPLLFHCCHRSISNSNDTISIQQIQVNIRYHPVVKLLYSFSVQRFSVPYESEQQGTNAKLAVEKYQRLTPLKHILYRPDSYIGSAFLSDEQPIYVYDAVMKRILKKEARIVPGLLKIFDEILVNAADNKRRDPEMTTIAVNIDRERNTISIWNNGRGIPIEIHPSERIYVPTMIFGTLFTSSNYDDSELKIVELNKSYERDARLKNKENVLFS
ncbi:hypothetical protein X798_03402 [Onchocerca flexuosa]|uniref:DNA topoisomerase (ATP-hydrolyzing) n=1 Tax=Onchocerca flexuosa TaxID=387005 RepID=A0A238BWZ4_9BILA|nr:hypothetical protein X798_03402 [Onchocerca flexuosa]